MKFLFLLTALVFSTNAMATVDGSTSVFLMLQNYQSEEYYVQKVPVVGCWGINKEPELRMLTREYMIPEGVGCGSDGVLRNANALSCAKVVAAKESDDYMTYSVIEIDIKKCRDKDDVDIKRIIGRIKPAAHHPYRMHDRVPAQIRERFFRKPFRNEDNT